MRYLVLSDLHANWEGLEAVLADANGGYDQIICLGDVVGYGADPNAVTDWVRENVPTVIRGNHDKACCGLEDPEYFNPIALKACQWTAEVLTETNRNYLRELPQGPLDLDHFLMVHGSLRDEDEYIIGAHEAVCQMPLATGRVVLFGHTHLQGGFATWNTPMGISMIPPTTGRMSLPIETGRTYLVNPGSVGQPRDHIWEAGYAIFDTAGPGIEYRRCPYDIETAKDKILDAKLPPALAERLSFGQ